MMTGKTPFFAKVSYGLSIAMLTLSFTSGVSAVRAESEDPALSWREALVVPIVNAVHEVKERLASLEATVALSAVSFGSQQITTNELCVADNTGAQACITKAQLDGLLETMARTAASERAAAAAQANETFASHGAQRNGSASIEIAVKPSAVADSLEVEMTTAAASPALAAVSEPGVMPDEKTAMDEEAGSVIAANSGRAVVSYPAVEISIPAPVRQSSD